MALVLKEKLHGKAEFALWKIEEEDGFYNQKLVLSKEETAYILSIKHPAQRTRWLASRYLLKDLMKTDEFVELLADAHGKPYISNFPLQISISHSNKYAAVILSKTHNVGIDVEEVGRNIEPLKHKFLSVTELQTLQPETQKEQLLLYWAAKEVMYKMYAKKKLEFKYDMLVKPFELKQKGYLFGILTKNDQVFHYNMSYLLMQNYVLVYGIEHITS
ncbi:MAG: 4'-phosphopantetheinyl transferase family protein [Chitinophagales bacterium]